LKTKKVSSVEGKTVLALYELTGLLKQFSF